MRYISVARAKKERVVQPHNNNHRRSLIFACMLLRRQKASNILTKSYYSTAQKINES